MQQIKFDNYSAEALRIMEKTNQNLFFTGKAGCGKSTIINYFISKTKKRFVLLGTTGISAQNIQGETIHKYFGITVNCKLKQLTLDKIKEIQETDIFIIDEISMFRSDLFDILDYRMKKTCQNNEILGGKQFIFVGDLYQLPPVIIDLDEKYESGYFFHAKNFDNFHKIELQKVHRQSDDNFIKNLNWIREGIKSPQILEYFNKRVVKKEEINPQSILIATTNSIVDKTNKEKLDNIDGQLYSFQSFRGGEFERDEFPTSEVLELKIGARIMFVVNDKQGRYQNGTLGTITNINPALDILTIDIDGFGEIEILKFTWNKKRHSKKEDYEDDGDDEIIGYFKNFPIKLAFAITVHKVQGKSFDNVVIDMGKGAFAEGQLYVALSRCRSYEGLQLIKPIKINDIICSQKVREYLTKNI